MLSKPAILPEVEKVVTLKKKGVNFVGLCPFHDEKTASFTVSTNKEIFHCFGCGATGDVIDFVQKYYNLDFLQAMKHLDIESSRTPYSEIKQRKILKDNFSIWEAGYFQELCLILRVCNKLLKSKLSWTNREIIYKTMPVCEYLADIIQFGSDKQKYELYKDTSKVFDYKLIWS